MKHWKNILVVMSLGLLHTQCAIFRANRLPELKTSEVDFKPERKVKIFSRWTSEFDALFMEEKARALHASMHKQLFEELVKETDCCTIVDSTDEADVAVHGKTFGEVNGSALLFALVTGATLYLIPSWATQEVRVEVQAKGHSKTKDYKLDDAYTLAQWLPFIVVAPFQEHGPYTIDDAVAKNVFANLLLKMKQDGLLTPKPGSAVPAS